MFNTIAKQDRSVSLDEIAAVKGADPVLVGSSRASIRVSKDSLTLTV